MSGFRFQGAKLQTRVGLLMLLSTWLADCPVAVTHFLSNSANVPYVSFTRRDVDRYTLLLQKVLLINLIMWVVLNFKNNKSVSIFISRNKLSLTLHQLISQVSSSEGEELELIVQGLCAFVLGLCMVSNDDQNPAFTK